VKKLHQVTDISRNLGLSVWIPVHRIGFWSCFDSGIFSVIFLVDPILFFTQKLLGILAASTLLVICYAADMTGDLSIRSYQDVMYHYLGPVGKKLTEFILTLYLAGACIVYLTIVGDSLTPLVNYFLPYAPFIYHREFLIAFFAVMCVFPLSLLRKVKMLSIPSTFANLGILYLGIIIILTAFIVLISGDDRPHFDEDILFFNTRLYHVIPQFFMSLSHIFNFFFHTFPELSRYSDHRLLVPMPRYYYADLS